MQPDMRQFEDEDEDENDENIELEASHPLRRPRKFRCHMDKTPMTDSLKCTAPDL